jgi:hypothetical protein
MGLEGTNDKTVICAPEGNPFYSVGIGPGRPGVGGGNDKSVTWRSGWVHASLAK